MNVDYVYVFLPENLGYYIWSEEGYLIVWAEVKREGAKAVYVFYLGRGKDMDLVLLPDLPHDRVDGAHHAIDLRVVSISHQSYFQPAILQTLVPRAYPSPVGFQPPGAMLFPSSI